MGINKSKWLLYLAGIFYSACIFDFFIKGVARGEGYTEYTYAAMFDFVTQNIGNLFLFWLARTNFKFNKLPRCVAQFYIDLEVTDMCYNLFGNPYKWELPKLYLYGIAFLIFLLIYYFEYISLWHYLWLDKFKKMWHKYVTVYFYFCINKFKLFYHDKFKNKNNGRKS